MNLQESTAEIKHWLEGHGLFVREFPNGQLQVDGVNLWVSSGKWYDPKKNVKGQGENSFLEYVTTREEFVNVT